MRKPDFLPFFVCGFFVVLLTSLGIGSILAFKFVGVPGKPPVSQTPPVSPGNQKMEKFTSESEFKEYIQNLSAAYSGISSAFGGNAQLEVTMNSLSDKTVPSANYGTDVTRVSQTNAQTFGIDEPDIVKTDGTQVYYSSEYFDYYPLIDRGFTEDITMRKTPQNETKVIKAFPPEQIASAKSIDKNGNLLLDDKTLVIFSGTIIYGYDVSDAQNPTQKWTMTLEKSNEVVDARLYDKTVYLVTRAPINVAAPCPIKPVTTGGVSLEIACTDIYHPAIEIPADTTYTALTFNPETGAISHSVSFVGSSSSSIVYMSENGLYLTYPHFTDLTDFFYAFLSEQGKDLFPAAVLTKIKQLKSYELSQNAKIMELQTIIENYQDSLDDDERLRIENELSDRMNEYLALHNRELERTGIIKISLPKMEIEAVGDVPGSLLNQFSLDEYENRLRVATTISGGTFGSGSSISDVYILDDLLQETGSVKDLGKGEQIYAVRFIEDKGYVVTFKQIDPFFVLDLSDPAAPSLEGELKIPGYSAYLHPISKDRILGIGKEGDKVKISLFDVSDPKNPDEIDTYALDEYWTEIITTHHAFLIDKKHQVFFMPGSKGGYVFGYNGDKLSLVKATAEVNVKRALYINDYLYIISSGKIVVLNENNWTEVKSLAL